MAQEEGPVVTSTKATLSITTTGPMVTNGGESASTTTTGGPGPVLTGTAERNSKTGLSLTLTPIVQATSGSLDLKEQWNGVQPSSSSHPATPEHVFVDTNASPNSTVGVANAAVAAGVGVTTLGKGRQHIKGPKLTDKEEEATKEFLEIVNGARVSKGISPLSWNAGVKFLMARKFNVRRSLELYNLHQVSRHTEGLHSFEPESEPLKSELSSGKFTVLPTRDVGGAAIAVFTAKLHQPSTVAHEFTLKGVVYQLDAALEDPQTQRSGLVFIYDMSDSKYSNFDYDLSIKILSLLKGNYPARLKKVLVVTAPLWFRAPFKILRLFVREKLRDRVFTVSVPQLGSHIPHSSLPKSLGGHLEVNHDKWLSQCHNVLSTADLWGTFTDDTVPIHPLVEDQDQGSCSKEGSSKPMENDQEADNVSNGLKKMRRNGTSTSQSTPSPTPNSSGSSGFSDDDSLPFDERAGLTLIEFAEHLKQKGRRGLLDEYAEIVSKNPEGSFNASRQRGNVSKNRYSDVLCFDHTRVILSSQDDSDNSDYINANFVDGYKQKNAFIFTQGPLPRTFGDFWKMIWEQTVVSIVMTTRTIERGRTKCGQYWPPDSGSTVTHEEFKIENIGVESLTDYSVTKLKLSNVKTEDSREITHLQFLSWPDYGVPSSAAATLTFLQAVRDEQASRVAQLGAKWEGHALGPPIVVHCSAGIGRTGTLCTMDVCMNRLIDQGTIDIMGTVERIRSQRAYSIQVPEQYLFCHAAIVEFATSNELLTEEQTEGLPDLLAEALRMIEEREEALKGIARTEYSESLSAPPMTITVTITTNSEELSRLEADGNVFRIDIADEGALPDVHVTSRKKSSIHESKLFSTDLNAADPDPISQPPQRSGSKITVKSKRLSPEGHSSGSTISVIAQEERAAGSKINVTEALASGSKINVPQEKQASGSKINVPQEKQASGSKINVPHETQASRSKINVPQEKQASGSKINVTEAPASGSKINVPQEKEASGSKINVPHEAQASGSKIVNPINESSTKLPLISASINSSKVTVPSPEEPVILRSPSSTKSDLPLPAIDTTTTDTSKMPPASSTKVEVSSSASKQTNSHSRHHKS